MPRSPSPYEHPRRDAESRRSHDDYEQKGSSSRRDREKSRRDDRYERDDRNDREHDGLSKLKSERDRDRDREHRKDRYRDSGDERDRDRDRKRRDRSRSRDRDRDRSHRKEKKRRESRTPSPGRIKRREAKAAAKAASKRETELEQSRALAEVSMYSAADNPFHDANIGEQFVWGKKREKEKKAGLTAEDIERKDAVRRQEAKEELARLNKRRADREFEMALREQEEIKQKRLAEDAQMAEWIAKEDDFQLEQSRRRAGIRLREQRAKAIDFLAINLRFADVKALGRHTAAIGALANPRKNEVEREEEEEGWGWADAGFEFEIDEPWKIFDNLNMEDCVELEQDIRMYLSLEKSPINIEFWEAMMVVCQHHLERFKDPDHAEGGRLFDHEVDKAAGKIVSGLSLARLVELENKTNAMLRSGQPVDGEFWDLVLKKIHVEKAISKLNSIHEVVLKNRLEQFKKRQREDAARVQAELGGVFANQSTEDAFGGDIQAEGADDADDEMDEDDFVEEYDPCMSPVPVNLRAIHMDDRTLPIVTEEDCMRELFASRHAITAASFVPKQPITRIESELSAPNPFGRLSASEIETERYFRAQAQIEKNELGSEESEEEFGDLADGLDLAAPANYDWSDRYRPRKPRYFNRVHTGFEWSRYNQTHYDADNPPPKVVQGYKFNIFYPDLIDKSKAPTYYIKKIPGDMDTQIIVFTAGPPYEDIAFRIVRRPWEYSHRRGFRSLFDKGVLQLYFNFGRNFYRK